MFVEPFVDCVLYLFFVWCVTDNFRSVLGVYFQREILIRFSRPIYRGKTYACLNGLFEQLRIASEDSKCRYVRNKEEYIP